MALALLIVAIGMMLPYSAHAMSDEELRAWQQKNTQEKITRERSVNVNHPSLLLKKKKEKKRKKRRRKKRKKTRNPVVSQKSDAAPLAPFLPDHSLAPARISSTTNNPEFAIFSDSPGNKTTLRFGVPWGAWARATLKRMVNSHDEGAIEIWLKEDLVGKFRTIPVGTLFRGSHRLNKDTGRLSIRIQRAITPSGKEFRLDATIYDLAKRNGLQGYRNNPAPNATHNAVASGIEAATEAVMKQILVPVNPLAAGLAATGNSLVKQQLPKKQTAERNIRVDPQDLYLRFDESL